jgi:hypothetical protein
MHVVSLSRAFSLSALGTPEQIPEIIKTGQSDTLAFLRNQPAGD